VVVGNHDRRRQGLSNDLAAMVCQREYYLESQLLGMVSAVAGNPHGRLHLKVRPRAKFRGVLQRPVLDLVRVKDDDSSRLVVYPSHLIIRVLELFAPGPFALPPYALITDVDVATVLWFELVGVPVWHRARTFPAQPGSALRSLQSGPPLLLHLHGARADQSGMQLKHIRRRLRRRLRPQLGFADGVFWKMDFCDARGEM
jgi:hypothetical protein